MKPNPILFILTMVMVTMNPLIVPGQNQILPLGTGTPAEVRWVDSVMQTLSLDERIAQLFNVRAYSGQGSDHVAAIAELVSRYKIGGLTFFQGGPVRQALLTNYYQGLAEVPLMIAIDAEWGLGMRLDSCFSFPYQMTLGAMDGEETVYAMASEIALQLRRMGVHMNFAPVSDINNNPNNPVIHVRSFGEDPDNVARKAAAYCKGLSDYGIIATAKHFPGHGDTDSDSHYTLPFIAHSRARLDSVELFPYREMIRQGLSGVMIAHLFVPSLDSTPNLPSTLSEPIVTGLLREELDFNGLIVTDALDMKGASGDGAAGEMEVKAFLAGNDVLLLSIHVPEAIARIREMVGQGRIPDSLVNEKCRKVLQYKYRAGLNHYRPVETGKLWNDLQPIRNRAIERSIYQQAVTLAWNPSGLLPLTDPDTLRLATVSIGASDVTPFQQMLGLYLPAEQLVLPAEPGQAAMDRVQKRLEEFDLAIIALHDLPVWKKSISGEVIAFINRVKQTTPVIINLFGHPYYLKHFTDLDHIAALVVSYQDGVASEEISAQMIAGSLAFKGHLPVSASAGFPAGSGITTLPNGKIRFTVPEELGIDPDSLYAVDTIAERCIRDSIYPGCQILAMKDGHVFYNRCFGYHTYDNLKPVSARDLYDVASVTKIAATTLAVMKLYQEKRIDIDQMLVTYLPFLKGTDKAPIIIREMMAHQARLKPWIPFYVKTMKDGMPDPEYYRPEISEDYPVRVAEGMYIRKDYIYSIYDSIARSPLLAKPNYKYSDLGFYLLFRIIENVTNMPFERYVEENFYKPLSLSTACFRPRERFGLGRIVPTENDTYFRMKLVHGDVHDPGAAMMGGVSGHAGLFSNATDLAVIMQMLIQKGEYGGKRILDSTIIDEFTRQQFPLNSNRRGIGFDKPTGNGTNGPACAGASARSYGHSGFTGTYVWADPVNNLVYVFLSNRVYPDAANNKLIDQDIRLRIHEVFYKAVK